MKGVMRAIARALWGRKTPPVAVLAQDECLEAQTEAPAPVQSVTRPVPRVAPPGQQGVVCMACKCGWTVPASMPLPAPCPNCEYYAGVTAFVEVLPLSPEESEVRAAYWSVEGPPSNPTSWYNPN